MAPSRKQSREITYRLIFACMQPDDNNFEIACGEFSCPVGPELEYVKKLVAACFDNLDAIDEIIKAQSKGFSFDRIFKTDLAALRMGIAELRFFMGTPGVVAVNEAVEIAKRYGTEKSGGFVNGILAQVLNGKE